MNRKGENRFKIVVLSRSITASKALRILEKWKFADARLVEKKVSRNSFPRKQPRKISFAHLNVLHRKNGKSSRADRR